MGCRVSVIVGRERVVLAIAALLVVCGAIFGADINDRLSPAGFQVPGSEARQASQVLGDEFGAGESNVVVLVTVPEGDVDAAEFAAIGRQLTEQLARVDGVRDVFSWWTTGAPQLRSNAGDQALIVGRLVGDDDTYFATARTIDDLFEREIEVPGASEAITVKVGGFGAVNLDLIDEGKRDLLRAELIAIPLTTILLLFVFRSLLAALLPLAVAAIAVIGTTVVLKVMSEFTLVSTFGLNITTALGLGMAIDFSLFMISRYREERQQLEAQRDLAPVAPTPQAARALTRQAVAATMATAGRSVVFSALTSAAAIAGLLVFNYPLLRSLAYAGFSVILLAMLGAIVVLPALLLVIGDNLDRWGFRAPKERPIEQGRWFKLAMAVNRRPLLVGVAVTAVLIAVAFPFTRAAMGIADDRTLPATTESRQVSDTIRSDFGAAEFGAITVVAPTTAGADLGFLAGQLSSLDNVARVDSSDGTWVGGQLAATGSELSAARFTNDEGRWWSVIPAIEPISGEAEDLVAEIRSITTPADVLVGGEPAHLVDNKAEISSKLPWMLLWVAFAMCALLWWAFRSLLMPLKAIALNLLSLTATFGALVWIFQDGNLSGLLGFTPTGLIDMQSPIILFCIAFGLSMDYEVFLLSRTREEWLASGDNARSVAVGLQRTGGIITAAAILMAVVFGSFATGNVVSVQIVGVGLAIAVLVDAFVVRSLLVPAFMSLAGDWNWRGSLRRSSSPAPAPAVAAAVAGAAGAAGVSASAATIDLRGGEAVLDLTAAGQPDPLGGIDYDNIAEPLLVTGANGFVGSGIVDRCVANGVSVLAFVLLGETVPERWAHHDVAVRFGDVRDAASVRAAVAEAGSVIHLAAYVSDWGPRRAYEDITVGGTENVLAAAADLGKPIVLASSIAVYGHRLDDERCDEASPLGQDTGNYSWAKQQQEFIARHHIEHNDLHCVIVRPGNVYGPGSPLWVDEIVVALRRGPVILGSGDTPSGLAHVDNVVDVFLACAADPATRGQIFNATDQLPTTWRKYCQDLAIAADTAPPRSIPVFVAKIAAVVLEAIWRVLRLPGRPQLTREAVRFVTADLNTPNTKMLALLQRPLRVDYQTGMRALRDAFDAAARTSTETDPRTTKGEPVESL